MDLGSGCSGRRIAHECGGSGDGTGVQRARRPGRLSSGASAFFGVQQWREAGLGLGGPGRRGRAARNRWVGAGGRGTPTGGQGGGGVTWASNCSGCCAGNMSVGATDAACGAPGQACSSVSRPKRASRGAAKRPRSLYGVAALAVRRHVGVERGALVVAADLEPASGLAPRWPP
jgi:hypothetical protein